ncbi:hypothetical protein [Phyllobacterium myrsinacearum]|uniref:Uncharacterized protein n=1 Tax=Phyllobacterium myrsinacearum TaxID=28101 RepID=A0A839EXR2_9HYPH|nr:hypothetical protein [Phyllobacterium myrsinacearum]MBA8882066.1 hypothetical protein [Phyllobacterium myrsinacearum]
MFGRKEDFDLTRAGDKKKRILFDRHRVRMLEWRLDMPITRAKLVNQLAAVAIAVPD